MRRTSLRILIYSVCFVIPIFVAGSVGYLLSMQAAMSPAPENLVNSVETVPPPRYDASKPTVAIVLGDPLSEVTDVLGPYALFAMSDKYNVYTVASSKTLRTLTGNLDILPHYSFEELETLLGDSPDVIVVPAIPDIHTAKNKSILAWLNKHKNDSLLFSWCTGAEVLAAAGLLTGKEATTHWADLGWLERKYPNVKWQRGLRYVDNGSLLTSAGLTSGIDATLYFLAKRHGEVLAETIARDIHYPSFQFVSAPQIEQYTLQAKDSIYFLNAMFYWWKEPTGVWLYDGVGELELASIFDVYAASWINKLSTFANEAVIRSRLGLYLVPRYSANEHGLVDRVLISGSNDGVQKHFANTAITQLHTGSSFAFDEPLRDLAKVQGVPTAAFAAKRLEYRAELELQGGGWPVQIVLIPLLAGLLGLGAGKFLVTRVAR